MRRQNRDEGYHPRTEVCGPKIDSSLVEGRCLREIIGARVCSLESAFIPDFSSTFCFFDALPVVVHF